MHTLEITGRNDKDAFILIWLDHRQLPALALCLDDTAPNPQLHCCDGTTLEVDIDVDGVMHFHPLEFGTAQFALRPGDSEEDTHDLVTLTADAPFSPPLLIHPPFPSVEVIEEAMQTA